MECGWPVIDIEQDGVVIALRPTDEFLHGLEFDVDAFVVEQFRVEVGEMGAVPVHHVWCEFGDNEAGAFSGEGLESGGESVSHTESADEDSGLPDRFEWRAGELGECFLRAVGEARHELFAV